MDNCPDAHDALKLVPNRADRRRTRRKAQHAPPPWTAPPKDRRDLTEGIHNYDHRGLD